MFTGSCVALVTPMNQDGGVDYAAISDLVEWHIESGTSAIVAVGTTGESATLEPEEIKNVITLVVEATRGRIPVIAGTGHHATHKTILRTQQAKDLGCDAALIVTPYYNKPTQQGLFEHYRAIVEAVDLPVILYNVPSRTACDLLPQTVIQLSQLDRIVGIKEATGDISRLSLLIEECSSDFRLYSGDDSTALDFMSKGGHGVISVVANIAPKLFNDMCQSVFQGDLSQASLLNDKLKPLYKALAIESNPIPVKWALKSMGKIDEGIRLPLTPLSKPHQSKMVEVLEEVGVMNV